MTWIWTTSASTTRTRATTSSVAHTIGPRRVVAVVAAAGQGTRLGAPLPKAFVDLAGASVLARSVAGMKASGVVDEIVVLVSPEMEDLAREQLAGHDVTFAHGGRERADSIFNGLSAIDAEDNEGAVVLIHDAARALTPPEMIRRVVDAVHGGHLAAIPVLPVADTIKVVEGDTVLSTPSRARLRAVQTPQGFDLATLRRANEAYFASQRDFEATDDASLMEWFGIPVATVAGDPLAFKITTPLDLQLALSVLGS
ncbi:2-C-methyl-D-erythritol 4-phosphate cytidylyltransferase [Corynebacterium sp. LK2510]|uniref:2-C-methyl-D-erythritol 4-phosphate cytidylyltransferase n=1 Tax=Corynebacterium sp. LK2510 TaxID=3110472 RepID=UPI003908079C